jgi:hypothetical protein
MPVLVIRSTALDEQTPKLHANKIFEISHLSSKEAEMLCSLEGVCHPLYPRRIPLNFNFAAERCLPLLALSVRRQVAPPHFSSSHDHVTGSTEPMAIFCH